MTDQQLNLFDLDDELTISSLINGRLTTNKLKDKMAGSSPKVDTSNPKVDTSNLMVDTSITKVDTRTKLSKALLKVEIMSLCQSNYIKMEEEATILGKSVECLKNKVFYTHNHPEQGYKTAEKYAKEL